jgi:hypothetical protein
MIRSVTGRANYSAPIKKNDDDSGESLADAYYVIKSMLV